jgi:hypothetical protein
MVCRLQTPDGTFLPLARPPRITAPTKPAHDELKEVLSVIKITIALDAQAGFGMPASGRVRVSALQTSVDATPVCGYRHIAVDAAVKGAFPGTSAWSPPI